MINAEITEELEKVLQKFIGAPVNEETKKLMTKVVLEFAEKLKASNRGTHD